MKTSIRTSVMKVLFIVITAAMLSGCYAHGGVGFYSSSYVQSISALLS